MPGSKLDHFSFDETPRAWLVDLEHGSLTFSNRMCDVLGLDLPVLGLDLLVGLDIIWTTLTGTYAQHNNIKIVSKSNVLILIIVAIHVKSCTLNKYINKEVE